MEIELHVDEVREYVGQELKTARIDVVKDCVVIPKSKRKVKIVNHGRLVGIYYRNYAWNARLEKNNGKMTGIELTTFNNIDMAKDRLAEWAGEPFFCIHLFEKDGFEGLSMQYCLGRSDVEITLKMHEKYDWFRKHRIGEAMNLLKRYE